MEIQHEKPTGFPNSDKSRQAKEAAGEVTRLLETWCAGRFTTLPPAFSPQMKYYWTPKAQAARSASLGLIRASLDHLAIFDQTPSHVSNGYIYLVCQWDSRMPAAKIILRKNGPIMAFYI